MSAAGRFVLTGGHGVGKSSLIRALEADGETVVYEAAQDVRLLLEAQGVAFPTDRDDFEGLCIALHRQREARARLQAERVFLDRGAPDHLVYAELGRWTLTADEITYCLRARYDAAFLVLPHTPAAPTLTRSERAFSQRLSQALREMYAERLGVVVHEVPPGALTQRVDYVLDRCTTNARLR
jgi:predicted ATPase